MGISTDIVGTQTYVNHFPKQMLILSYHSKFRSKDKNYIYELAAKNPRISITFMHIPQLGCRIRTREIWGGRRLVNCMVPFFVSELHRTKPSTSTLF